MFADTEPKRDTSQKEKSSREEKQNPQPEWEEEKRALPPLLRRWMKMTEVLAAKLKAKDSFAHLPKMTFVLNDVKDTLSVALPYFDKDGWSL